MTASEPSRSRTVGADILDELELMRFTRIDPIRENAILKRAKDEIGRLRGEVERLSGTHGQAPICYGLRVKGSASVVGVLPMKVVDHPPTSREYSERYEEIPLYIAPVREAPAPAMPNGVEAARVLADFAETAPGRLPGRVQEAIATIRAADNRDAAGVVREAFAKGDAPTAGYEKYWDDAPAAVPAGEAVAWLASDGEVFTNKESADRHSKVWGVNPLLTPLYTAPPAPVQAAPQEGEVTLPGQRLTAVLLERYAGTTTAHAHGDTQDAAELARQFRALQHRGDSQEVGRG